MKLNIFGIVVLILLFSNVAFIFAADVSDISDNLEMNVDRLEETSHAITNEETQLIFLRTTLNKTSVGQSLFAFESNMQRYDSFFEGIFGVRFSYSFLFFLSVFFWLMILNLFWNISKSIEYLISHEFVARFVRYSFFVFFFFVLIFSNLSRIFASLFMGIFSSQTGIVMKLFSFIFLFAIMIFISSYSKLFKRVFSSLIYKRSQARKDKKLQSLSRKVSNLENRSGSSNEETNTDDTDGLSEDGAYAKAYLEELGRGLKENEKD